MKELLEFKLIELSLFTLTVEQLLALIIVILLLLLWLKAVKKIIYSKKVLDANSQFATYTIIKYSSILVSFYIALSVLDIQISLLLASSAGILVGIGLGLQHLFYDFFSGIIILLDGSIKVGNIIEFNGNRVEVKKISFRTSLVKTRDEKEIIVPNSILTKNEVINWSNQKSQIRQSIFINIREKDFDAVCPLIMNVLEKNEKVLKDPKPYIRIENFNDHGLNLKILFWSNELLRVGRMLGNIRLEILRELQANKITLPFKKYLINIVKESEE